MKNHTTPPKRGFMLKQTAEEWIRTITEATKSIPGTPAKFFESATDELLALAKQNDRIREPEWAAALHAVWLGGKYAKMGTDDELNKRRELIAGFREGIGMSFLAVIVRQVMNSRGDKRTITGHAAKGDELGGRPTIEISPYKTTKEWEEEWEAGE